MSTQRDAMPDPTHNAQHPAELTSGDVELLSNAMHRVKGGPITASISIGLPNQVKQHYLSSDKG
jgi:hypothetical protein